MEIPTAVIHRLQTSLRGAAGAPSFPADAGPAPPFPRFADAVAAFDAAASTSAPAELRCGRCGAAGGFLRGARSPLCVYCGSPRRGEGGGECEGGGVAFREGPAYRWLLGSLGHSGSEPVEFDNESTGPNKSKEAPKSGLIVSDLLDLKLTSIPENKEAPASSMNEEQSSAAHTPNITGVSVDSFFIERKEATPAVTVSQSCSLVQEKQTTDSKILESSRSEMHAISTGLMTSQRTSQIEDTPAFANWDAEFQSASSVSASAESAQLDLFKGSSASESFSFPAAVTAINPVVGSGNETNVKSAIEHSEGLPSVDGTLVKENLFDQKVVHPILEGSSGIAPENSVPDLEFSVNKNSLKRDELQQRDDTGVNDDDAFDDWQEFTGGKNEGSISNAGEHKEEHLRGDSTEIKTIDPWPLGSVESPDNVNGDTSDDWQAFATSSGQEGEDLVKLTEGSTGGSVRLVDETTSNTSLEYPSQATSVNLWPMGNVDKHSTEEMVKQTKDSFDDWNDFTTSGQVQYTSTSQTGDMMEALTVSQKEINLDSWFMGNSSEAKNTDLVNGNNAVLNDWQGFTGSDQSQQNSKNNSLEHHETTDSAWVNDRKKDAANTSSTNMDSDDFDIWQDFAKSGQVTIASPEPAKEIDAMDFWLTSNVKESNNRDVKRIEDSSDGWQDLASFGQAQKSTKIPEEGHLVKDPIGTETLDLWASSNEAEKKLEEVSGNNDLFDDWQDFQNSGETSLQVFSDASSLDRSLASKPDAAVSLEFGTISGLVSSQDQKDENESFSVAKAIPFDEDSKSMNGMQQMGDITPLSAIWPTKDVISEPEPADANVGKLLSQMHDLSFMLKDELSVPDKPTDHSKP